MPNFTLDHVIIAVRDLDAASADYEALLGREPSWRGSHPQYGTKNRLFRIENTYVELLALADDEKKRGRWSGPLKNFLEEGEGLYGLALGTKSIDAAVRELRDTGLPVQDPAPGEGLDWMTGARRTWRNAAVVGKESRGVRLLFIEHGWGTSTLPMAEPNAAEGACVTRMDHAVVLSPDMEASRKLWGTQIGARLALDRTFPERDRRILFFRLGDITVEISGGAEQTEEGLGKPDRLWGLAWGVGDLRATVERLRAAGVDVSDARPGIKPGTLVATVKGEHTHGVPTLLIEHTPESFRAESRAPQGRAYDNSAPRRAFAALGLDHVSVVTEDAAAAAETWRATLGLAPGDAAEPPGVAVRLVDVPAGNAFVQIAQALSPDHRVARWVAERGPGMYGIAIEVDDIDAAVRDLRGKGIYVSDPEYGVIPGTRVARIAREAANGVQVELVQRLPEVL